ncbi:MAG: cytochrome b/b6 domain-containing protein [Pseudomonadota bacterium]
MTYSLSLRLAHWVMALLILGMATTGMMYFLEINGKQAIAAHQTMGQLLIIALAWRLLAKVRSPHPRHTDHPIWERALAGLVQLALYGLIIAFIVTGYVSASAYTSNRLLFPVDLAFARSATGEAFLETHYMLKWALVGLLSLHIAGALKHHFIDRDATLKSIWFGQKGD